MVKIKELIEKAYSFEEAGKFEKASNLYYRAAKELKESKENVIKYLPLLKKSFDMAKKQNNIELIFNTGLEYFIALKEKEDTKPSIGLVRECIEISQKKLQGLSSSEKKNYEDLIRTTKFLAMLYQELQDSQNKTRFYIEAATYSKTLGKQLLTSKALVNRELKMANGFNYYNEAIEYFNLAGINQITVEEIITTDIDLIGHLIDKNKIDEGKKLAVETIKFAKENEELVKNLPAIYSKIAIVFNEKAFQKLREKKFEIAKDLMEWANDFHINAGGQDKICSSWWTFIDILGNMNQKDKIIEIANYFIDLTIEHNDFESQKVFLDLLATKGKNISEGLLNSKLIKVRKHLIELPTNEGFKFLQKHIELTLRTNNNLSAQESLDYIHDFSKRLYEERGMKLEALPYFEYLAKQWWSLKNNQKVENILKFIDEQILLLYNSNKANELKNHADTYMNILTTMGEIEKIGIFSLKIADYMRQLVKTDYELLFINLSYEKFNEIKSQNNLKKLLEYVENRLVYLIESYPPETKDFIEAGDKISTAISSEENAFYHDWLMENSYQKDNINLASQEVDIAFDKIKTIDISKAAESMSKAVKYHLNHDLNVAMNMWSKNIRFLKENNLNEQLTNEFVFLEELIRKTDDLTNKFLFIKVLEELRKETGQEQALASFLFETSNTLFAEKQYNEGIQLIIKTLTIEMSLSNNTYNDLLKEYCEWISKEIGNEISNDTLDFVNALYDILMNTFIQTTSYQPSKEVFFKIITDLSNKKHFSMAFLNYEKFLSLQHTLKQPESEIIDCAINASNILRENGATTETRKIYQKVFEYLSKEIKDMKLLNNLTGQLTTIAKSENDLNEAIAYYTTASNGLLLFNDQHTNAANILIEGGQLIAKQNKQSALKLFETAKNILIEKQDKGLIESFTKWLFEINEELAKENRTLFEQYVKVFADLNIKTNNKIVTAQIYELLAKKYILQKETQNAYRVLKEAVTILLNEDAKDVALEIMIRNSPVIAQLDISTGITIWQDTKELLIKDTETFKQQLIQIASDISKILIVLIKSEDKDFRNVNILGELLIEVYSAINNWAKATEIADILSDFYLQNNNPPAIKSWTKKGLNLAKDHDVMDVLRNIGDRTFITIKETLTGLNNDLSKKKTKEQEEFNAKIQFARELLQIVKEEIEAKDPNFYYSKIVEIFPEMYEVDLPELITETSNALKFLRASDKPKAAQLLYTMATYYLKDQKIDEGIKRINETVLIYRELQDEKGLIDSFNLALKEASNYPTTSFEHKKLSQLADKIQQTTGIKVDDTSSDAFLDLFDTVIGDTMSLFDKKKKKKKKK